jgi:catechol 2,3-dioxygenase-like lactoylglutathione lyase family enzyme
VEIISQLNPRGGQMLKLAIPLLHVSNSAAAESFFCNQLGFRREFAHCAGEGGSDPCYMGVSRDGDGASGGVVNLIVDDVDALHAELTAKGVGIDMGPVDQTWGTREMYVKDVDGNSVRFIQS